MEERKQEQQQRQATNPSQTIQEEDEQPEEDDNSEAVREKVIPFKIEDDEEIQDGLTIDGDKWCIDGNGQPIRVDDVIRAASEMIADNQTQGSQIEDPPAQEDTSSSQSDTDSESEAEQQCQNAET